MSTNYVLIDYENVKADNLDLLARHPFKVMIFVGANQPKIPIDLAIQVQELQAEYVKMSGSGPNALDFHIAFYVGVLSEREPEAYFHIVSKDKGFDPLINHLKKRKTRAGRVADVSELPPLRTPLSAEEKERIDLILKDLSARGSSRPRRVKTLTSTISSLFKGELGEKKASSLIRKLQAKGYVVVDGVSVTYRLPRQTPSH